MRPTKGAILAVCGSMGGGVAIIMTAAWWLTPSRPEGALESPRKLSLRVKYKENEGWDSTGEDRSTPSAWRVVSAPHGAELEVTCTRSDLLFGRIQEDAEGWPPDLAGWFGNGLVSYEIEATAEILGGREVQRTATSIAPTKNRDQFKVFIPWTKKESADPRTPWGRFSANASGVVDLATEESNSKP